MHDRKGDTRRRHPTTHCENCGEQKTRKGNTAQLYCRPCYNARQRLAQLDKRARDRVLREKLGLPQAPEGRGSEEYKTALALYRHQYRAIGGGATPDHGLTPLNDDAPPDPADNPAVLQRHGYWRNTDD